MTRKVLFSAIAAAVGLLGCAGASKEAALHCNQGVCKVAVTITDCAAKGGVSVAPDPLAVSGSNNIEWDIATPGYSFVNSSTQNGIVIQDFYKQFGRYQQTSKKAKVHNGNTNQIPVYYAVYVMKDDGTPCVPLDPWINNL